MSKAFMGQIFRVNLEKGVISKEDLRMDWARQFLGAAGLGTRYLYDLVPKGTDPLGRENPLIFMTGPLTGTPSASASRYSVIARSPQTGLWGQANSGGTFGPALKWSGYDGIIFEGISPQPVYLRIVDGQAELCDATHLWGKTVPETEDLLLEENPSFTVACIGPAGENLVRFAAIMNNKHRAAGRCGLGAVMGSKRLKAIACDGHTTIELADRSSFIQTAYRQREYMDESLLKIGFDTFGTTMIADMVNVRGGYPVRNWQKSTFDDIEEVNAQAISDRILIEGVRCFACPVACGRKTEIREGKWQGHGGEGPEYETTNTLGAMCGVSDLNAIAMANYRCNEYGMDTISAGGTIAFAMECYEKGMLADEWTGGQPLKFGDADLVVELIEKIALRQGIGDLLAEGSRIMAERVGQGSLHFAIHVKGLELPAYDPRAAKITGLGYVTANRGGDHMTGYVQGPSFIDIPFLIVDDSSIGDPFIANPQETQVLVDMENALATLDATGGCKFMGILLTAQELTDLIVSATGWDFSVQDFRRTGERIYNLERAFCVREGLRRDQDALPPRMMEDPLPDGPAEGMLLDREIMEMMKDAYYQRRGWDLCTGIPTPDKLHQLELDWLIPELWG
jgi:aldehyde:ferredoxin oxidoreductase